MDTSTQPRSDDLPGRLGAFVAFVVVACVLLALGLASANAAPAAGTVIGNQATATYNDAGGAARTATSNLVTTTVSQVKTFTLTADGARTAAPGQTVYYPHTITNTGNGTDTYALNAAGTGGAFTHGSPTYYIDANGDGVPDNATAIATSGPIPAGGVFRFVIAGTVPAGAAVGSTGTMSPSVSDTSGGAAVTNTDTTTVASSVITVTKALSSSSGASPAGPITVTLSYTNSGNAAATNVQLTDTLPAGMTYVAASGRWSVSGVTALTDGNDGTEQAVAFPPGIDYRAAAGVITAIIPSVPAGVSGTVTFQVNIASNLPPQTISNTAQFQTSTQASANTNAATYTVLRIAGVIANGSNASSAQGAGEAVTWASGAGPGSTITFNDYVWNKGNGTDTFDVTVTANSFPAGSTVTLLQQDGTSSLLNSGGSAAPDTGPIPGPGAACAAPLVSDGTYCGYKVVVRVTLPTTGAGTGPYSLTLTATSAYDASQLDTVIDTLPAVTANSVDVTNNTARTDSTPAGTAALGNQATTGFGASGATVIVTKSVIPTGSGSVSATYQLFVNNVGAVNDNFALSASLQTSTNASVPAPGALPAGWSVQFFADGGGNCATLGASISSTGTINANANRDVCAVVSVPATTSGTAYAGTYGFDFTATSSIDGTVKDSIRDALTVTAVRSITVTPNNTQQTFPGGSVTYLHTITNAGNAADTASFAASCLTDTRSGSGWTSAAYIDTNANGTLEIGTDTLITCGSSTLPLAVGQSVTIIVRVFAPPSAVATDPANVTTITATYGASTTSATDSTTVTDGLVLLKEQVAVSCAAAGPHAGYTTGAIPAGPATAPGQCIAYRVTGTNTTAGTINNVVISDIVPANTKMKFSCSGNGVASPTVSVGAMNGGSAADGATGTVIANVGTLTSTQAAVLYFCVRIDP